MRTAVLSSCIFSVCGVAAILAGCGLETAPPTPSPAGATAQRAHALLAFGVLHDFQGPPKDGSYASNALIDLNGTLYGTSGGGAKGNGAVYSITPSGAETVLYSFKGGSADGAGPSGALINVDGTLYGTTAYGGAKDNGTIFAVSTSGKESVIYSFKGGPADGAAPSGALLNVNGTLYGTTASGGSGSSCGDSGCGTVFSVTTSGKETVRHNFKGGKRDGQSPNGGLVNVQGTLYGTTNGGGANCTGGVACGTVFSITASGKETVRYSFKGGTDGQNPDAGVIYVNGKLYGTTTGGGGGCNEPSRGCGVAFASTLSGAETVLHSFGKNGRDGAVPQASLLNVSGTLYGTTIYGGESRGWGTVFEILTSGKERVLRRFNGANGDWPTASLINVKGTLYGATTQGGSGLCGSDDYYWGCGVIFTLKP
jgi:uncharacterized repeat protein (TIGR03803 family)